MQLDAKVPEGPLADKWNNHKFDMPLVNPSNRRRFEVIVVGTGLAGAGAAATLGELGELVLATDAIEGDEERAMRRLAALLEAWAAEAIVTA